VKESDYFPLFSPQKVTSGILCLGLGLISGNAMSTTRRESKEGCYYGGRAGAHRHTGPRKLGFVQPHEEAMEGGLLLLCRKKQKFSETLMMWHF